MNIPGYLIAEMIALAIGIWRYAYLPNKAFRALVLFLAFIVCVEWYGKIAGRDLGNAIGMLFNFSIPIEYMFYVWFLSAHYKNTLYIKLSKVFIIVFGVFSLVNNLTSNEVGFHGVYMKIGILGILVFCCLYFVELLKRDQIVNPVFIPTFWICSGLFIFNVGEFVYGFGITKLAQNPKAWNTVFQAINSNLNVILYSCISLAILMVSWRK